MQDTDMLVFGDGRMIEIGQLRRIVHTHPDIVGSLYFEEKRRNADVEIDNAMCPTCSKPITRGVQRWQPGAIGRMIWFETMPENPERPFVDRGDVLYFDYSDRPHHYTHNECGSRLPDWIANLLDGLVDDWWLPDDLPFDEGELV